MAPGGGGENFFGSKKRPPPPPTPWGGGGARAQVCGRLGVGGNLKVGLGWLPEDMAPLEGLGPLGQGPGGKDLVQEGNEGLIVLPAALPVAVKAGVPGQFRPANGTPEHLTY